MSWQDSAEPVETTWKDRAVLVPTEEPVRPSEMELPMGLPAETRFGQNYAGEQVVPSAGREPVDVERLLQQFQKTQSWPVANMLSPTSEAENRAIEGYKEEAPGLSMVAEQGGFLLNPAFAAVNALTAGAGGPVEGAVASKLASSPFLKNLLAPMAGAAVRIPVAAGGMAGLQAVEDPKKALETGSSVALLQAVLEALNIGRGATRGIKESIGKSYATDPSMQRLSSRRPQVEKAVEAQKAGLQSAKEGVEAAPLKEFLGEENIQKAVEYGQKPVKAKVAKVEKQAAALEEAATARRSAKAKAFERNTQDRVKQLKTQAKEAQSVGAERVERRLGPKVEEQAKEMKKFRSGVGNDFGDAATEVIAKNPDELVDVKNLKTFIKDYEERAVGLKDPGVSAELEGLRKNLGGLEKPGKKDVAGLGGGAKEQVMGMSEGPDEIPLRDFVEAVRGWKYQSADSPAAKYRNIVRRELTKTLGNGGETAKELSNLNRSYSDFLNNYDETQYRLSVPGGRKQVPTDVLD